MTKKRIITQSLRGDEKKADELGIREFLMKPVFVKNLARTIRKVLDGRTGET